MHWGEPSGGAACSGAWNSVARWVLAATHSLPENGIRIDTSVLQLDRHAQSRHACTDDCDFHGPLFCHLYPLNRSATCSYGQVQFGPMLANTLTARRDDHDLNPAPIDVV